MNGCSLVCMYDCIRVTVWECSYQDECLLMIAPEVNVGHNCIEMSAREWVYQNACPLMITVDHILGINKHKCLDMIVSEQVSAHDCIRRRIYMWL